VSWRLYLGGLIVTLGAATIAPAQLRLLPPPSGALIITPSPRGRIIISGSFGGFGPAFAPTDRLSFFSSSSDSRFGSIQVIAPQVTPRLQAPPVDLSGVDLDKGPPPWAIPADRPRHDLPPAPKPRPEEVAKRIEPPKPAPEPPMPTEKLPEPKIDPIGQAKRLADLGSDAFRAQEYGLAARRFQQAVDLDPANSRAYFLLGQAYMALGKYSDAVQAIGLGLGLDAAWPKSAFRPRFELYADNPAEWQRHLDLLDDAQKRQPNHAGYLFLLAYERWFDDHRPEAIELFRRVRPLVADPALVDLFLKATQ
jgi:tetratricopeptide repeat protein